VLQLQTLTPQRDMTDISVGCAAVHVQVKQLWEVACHCTEGDVCHHGVTTEVNVLQLCAVQDNSRDPSVRQAVTCTDAEVLQPQAATVRQLQKAGVSHSGAPQLQPPQP
jgi:hypothetical protein